jgi:competence protein ComEA
VDITRRQVYVYVAVALVVAAVGARYLLTSSPRSGGASPLLLPSAPAVPSSPSSSPSAEATQDGEPLVAYICGAVRRPGVYRLEPGSRVADLLARAGGACSGAQLEGVNLAAKLSDGQQVVVPKAGQAVAAGAAGATGTSAGSADSLAAPAAPVDLNTASLEELDALPGVGPSTAQKIVDYRTANGGFKSVDDLKNVSGIGDVRFAALKDLVTV